MTSCLHRSNHSNFLQFIKHRSLKYEVEAPEDFGKSFFAFCESNIKWHDIEALFVALGTEISEREGSRVEVFLFDEVRIFHRPHSSPDTDKGAVASIRDWLEKSGITP